MKLVTKRHNQQITDPKRSKCSWATWQQQHNTENI